MGKFVDVVDEETPKNERNDNSADMIKHRKFSSRGWDQGAVGYDTSKAKKDTGAQRITPVAGSFKMVKNHKGLWVKSSVIPDDSAMGGKRSAGRGSGIPLIPHDDFERESRSMSSTDKTYRGREEEWERPRDRDRRHFRSSPSRRRSRSRSRDRRDDRDYHISHHSHSHTERSRERSRSREPPCGRLEELPPSDTTSSNQFDDAPEASTEEPSFHFNAVQIVNRFLEIFSASTLSREKRISLFQELFAADAQVLTLKTQKTLLPSRQALLDSFFVKASFHQSTPTRRVFIALPGDGSTSFCLDLHAPGTSPGLGDPSKDSCLLYKATENAITQVWGAVDKEMLASLASLSLARIQASEVWRLAAAVISSEALSAEHIHYHDYTYIEVIGGT